MCFCRNKSFAFKHKSTPINNGFKHRQYSGYVSLYPISMAEVVQIIKKLSSNYTWLKYCVKEFDVTIVSDEYSMKSYIQPVDVFD